MPPRYVYWTILAGGLPTAFRATDRDELLPTFNRLRERHPDAELKYFARGRVWNSKEEADAARTQPAAPSRGKDWRPGGNHRDPRQRAADERKAKNQARRQERWDRSQAKSSAGRPPFSKPPSDTRPSGARPPASRPPFGRPLSGRPPSGKPPSGRSPSGKPPSGRPFTGRPPSGRPPSARTSSAPPPSGRPTGFRPSGPKPPDGQGFKRRFEPRGGTGFNRPPRATGDRDRRGPQGRPPKPRGRK